MSKLFFVRHFCKKQNVVVRNDFFSKTFCFVKKMICLSKIIITIKNRFVLSKPKIYKTYINGCRAFSLWRRSWLCQNIWRVGSLEPKLFYVKYKIQNSGTKQG
mgnify:CR=1 FL=1